VHTSDRLSQDDFSYRLSGPDGYEKKCFADLFPDYHPLDRTGIISPCLEDGILHAPSIILGLTTAFYDHLRALSDDFFNYPQHFSFIGGCHEKVNTGSGPMVLERDQIGEAWGCLDVWPGTNWIIHPARSENMLDQIYRYQINRVFWPASLRPDNVQKKLPPLVDRFLRNRLKSVWYYNPDDADVEILLSDTASHFVQESIDRLPPSIALDIIASPGEPAGLVENQFRMVDPGEFLDDMGSCFNSE